MKIMMLALLPAALLTGCTPRIEVAAPEEPITINMNVKIEHEIHIKVDASCCAGVTPESHEQALKSMEACQITIEKPRMMIDEKDLMD